MGTGTSSGKTGTASVAASGRTKSDEQIYNEQVARDREAIDTFLATKGDYNSLEVSGRIFEKVGSQKAFVKLFRDSTYGNDIVYEDDSWAFEYNDGTVAIYGPGDSLRGVRLRGIRNAIYENGSTTAFYGRDIEITDYSVQTRAWQRQHLANVIGRPGWPKNYDYEPDWRVGTRRL